jgi:hypothetical protein
VRQKAALGSFNIPNKHLGHPIWQAREGHLQRSQHRRACSLRERKALEPHAIAQGCRLILDPTRDYDKVHGPGATYARLRVLVEFLESEDLPYDKVEVAIRPRSQPYSLTILGDWFFAETLAGVMGTGYHQTMFTRHAPTVNSRLAAFDQEFEELLKDSGIQPSSSRAAAIGLLKSLMEEAPKPVPS